MRTTVILALSVAMIAQSVMISPSYLQLGPAIPADTFPGVSIRRADPGINLYNAEAPVGQKYFQILHSSDSNTIEFNLLPDDGSSVQTWWSFDVGNRNFNTGGLNTGFLRITNNDATQAIYGVGGTDAGKPSAIRFDGASGANSGPYHKFQRNSVDIGYLGSDAALRSNSSNDFNLSAVGNLRLGVGNGKSVVLPTLSGTGSAFACLDADGQLYRSTVACQ